MENEIKIINNSFEMYNDGCNYINQLRLFHAYFNVIPNIKSVKNIDTEKLKTHILEKYKSNILNTHYNKGYVKVDKIDFERDYFILLKEGILISLYTDDFEILFKNDEEKLVNQIFSETFQFINKPKKTKEISFIISRNGGLRTKELVVNKPKLNIDLHYNDDFTDVHKEVLSTIKKTKTKGLFLFHGLPGTGKSTYIKYLIHNQNKKVIFLSPKMAANLDSMAFTEFLLENPNTLLIIEDAEELITSRENHQNSQLSFLLNLTDGLIADSLGIQIIATFNTDLKNIDKALLRKGRLTAIYEFKELEFQKANILAETLKINNFETLKPMSLADIFNYKETNFHIKKQKNKIGF